MVCFGDLVDAFVLSLAYTKTVQYFFLEIYYVVQKML